MSDLLIVVATLTAKPGLEETVRQVLLALVEPTRNETDCVQYDLHESLETPGVFVFYEKWTSKAALEQHGKTPHLRGLAARVDELFVVPPDVRLYSRIA